MLERKTLAYGDGKIERPKMRKTLVFGAAVLVGMSSCSPAAQAIPRKDGPFAEIQRQEPQRPALPAAPLLSGCLTSLDPITIRPEERIVESRCRGNTEFVLTNAALYIRTNDDGREIEG